MQNRRYPGDASIHPGDTVMLERGIYVDGCLYMPDVTLSETATEDNLGRVIGCVSFDNQALLPVYAFEYIPEDGTTRRIIVPIGDTFCVYTYCP